MFNCASNQKAKVLDHIERRGDGIVWEPVFRRNLNKVGESQFQSLLSLVGDAFIPRDGKDRRIWMPSADGTFWVVSSFVSKTRDAVLTC